MMALNIIIGPATQQFLIKHRDYFWENVLPIFSTNFPESIFWENKEKLGKMVKIFPKIVPD